MINLLTSIDMVMYKGQDISISDNTFLVSLGLQGRSRFFFGGPYHGPCQDRQWYDSGKAVEHYFIGEENSWTH